MGANDTATGEQPCRRPIRIWRLVRRVHERYCGMQQRLDGNFDAGLATYVTIGIKGGIETY